MTNSPTNRTAGSSAMRISLLLVICLAVFLNTFLNDFVWDDPYLISGNRYLRDYRNIPLFFTPHYWKTLHPFPSLQGQYRPLRTTSFTVDYALWGLNPAGYHLTNLLLHMANVVLIFYLVAVINRRLDDKERERSDLKALFMSLPFLTAVFFAVHPIHTESVTYIKNRSDLLAFLFCLVSFLLFIRSRADTPWRWRLPLLTGSWLCFILAILSKEMALTLPALLALYVVCFQDQSERTRRLTGVIPYGLIVFLFFLFRLAAFNTAGLSSEDFQGTTSRHALAVVKTVGTYLTLLVFPINLNAERAFSIPESLFESGVVLSLAAMLIIFVLTVKSWNRSRLLFFAILWIFLALLPVANIVFLEARPIAEQRLYIPSFGFCLLLAWGINHLYRRGEKDVKLKAAVTAACLLTVLIITGYGCRTIYRNRDWRDPLTFYSKTIASNPRSARVQNNLGLELAETNRREEAIAHYRIALDLDPDHAHAHNNLAIELEETGHFQEAVSHYEKALSLMPDYASAHNNLGVALSKTGAHEEAIIHYQAAIQFKPDYVDAMNNLGLAYADTGRLEESISAYLAALRLEPDYDRALNNLGVALIKTGNIEEAISRLPAGSLSTAQLVIIYNSIGSFHIKQGRIEPAEMYYRQALRLDPSYTDGLYNLALALATGGKYQEAAGALSELLAITPNDKDARAKYAYCLKMLLAETAP